jgi:hypothetical protein
MFTYNKPSLCNTISLFSDIFGFRTLSIVLVIKTTVKNKKTVKNTTFRKLDLFPSSGEGKPTHLGPLETSSLSHWTVFLITRTMDRVRKLNISESDTPSSESYSNYLDLYYFNITLSQHVSALFGHHQVRFY